MPTAQAVASRDTYAARLPFTVLVACAAAARTFASARFTTCFVAFWNWSNAAVEAAIVDLNALTATSEPAGAIRCLLDARGDTLGVRRPRFFRERRVFGLRFRRDSYSVFE